MLARIMADTGETKAARDLYQAPSRRTSTTRLQSRIEYFNFERRHGDRAQAIAAYHSCADEGFRRGYPQPRPAVIGAGVSHGALAVARRRGLLLFVGLLLLFAAVPVLVILPNPLPRARAPGRRPRAKQARADVGPCGTRGTPSASSV
jgi:hypothetical protein